MKMSEFRRAKTNSPALVVFHFLLKRDFVTPSRVFLSGRNSSQRLALEFGKERFSNDCLVFHRKGLSLDGETIDQEEEGLQFHHRLFLPAAYVQHTRQAMHQVELADFVDGGKEVGNREREEELEVSLVAL